MSRQHPEAAEENIAFIEDEIPRLSAIKGRPHISLKRVIGICGAPRR
jgi:hypothetical protein